MPCETQRTRSEPHRHLGHSTSRLSGRGTRNLVEHGEGVSAIVVGADSQPDRQGVAGADGDLKDPWVAAEFLDQRVGRRSRAVPVDQDRMPAKDCGVDQRCVYRDDTRLFE